MFAFALPDVAVEVEAGLTREIVVATVAIEPTVICGVMLDAAKDPRVIGGSHDRFQC